MSDPLFLQVPAVPPVRIEKLAFFTLGDTRRVSSPHLAMTTEEMWRRRAETLAPGRAHGVATVQDALAVVAALEPDVLLDEVVFLGHGSADPPGFFFFSGDPEPHHNFASTNDDQLLEMTIADMRSSATFSRTKEFLITLFKSLAWSDPRVSVVKINFLACFMGQGETHRAVCDFLNGWLVGPREVRFEVGAYRNFYATVFVTNAAGRIVHWEDHVVVQPGGAELVPSPGSNQIPAFEVGCNGTVVRTPLLFEFADFYSTELDDGTLSEGLRQELALKGVVLSATATVGREGAGKWRIFDHPNGITYRVVLDGGVLKVYQP